MLFYSQKLISKLRLKYISNKVGCITTLMLYHYVTGVVIYYCYYYSHYCYYILLLLLLYTVTIDILNNTFICLKFL